MEQSSLSRLSQFLLTPDQRQELQTARKLSLPLESNRLTTVNLDAEKPILTVVTTFRSAVRRNGPLLRALNEANKATTLGCFICTESDEIALKTTTFYPEGPSVPSEQISEIVRSHYSLAVENLAAGIQATNR